MVRFLAEGTTTITSSDGLTLGTSSSAIGVIFIEPETECQERATLVAAFPSFKELAAMPPEALREWGNEPHWDDHR